LDEISLEEIPAQFIPPTSASVQSYSSGRQAESEIPSKADTEILRGENAGSTSGNSAKCWEKDSRNRW
jgi:hypothetical protein